MAAKTIDSIDLGVKQGQRLGYISCEWLGRGRGSEKSLQGSNQSPKGIMRSAVPLPCFFDVVKTQKVAGQRPG